VTQASLEPVTIEDLDALTDAWDAAVEADDAVDPFCTRMAWQLSYHQAFEPDRTLWLARAEDALVLLARSHTEAGEAYLEPLENMWGFASPIVGEGATGLLASHLLATPTPTLLLGLPDLQVRLAPLGERLMGRYGVRALEPTTRFVADLSEGLDGWLAGRTAKFRRNLRVAERRVEESGLRFDAVLSPGVEDVDALYATVLEVESRTWKSASGNGADRPPMRDFYAHMWPRLAGLGQLRVLIARDDAGRPQGYLHGALCGDRFRGLQVSFDQEVSRLGLGNVLQLRMLEHIVAEGARTYDLGARSEYKGRWAGTGPRTLGFVLRPAG
jgi:hypothetical protein